MSVRKSAPPPSDRLLGSVTNEDDDGLAALQIQVRAAKRAFYAAQNEFERDRKDSQRQRRKQDQNIVSKYFAADALLDRLSGKLSWARSAKRQAEATKASNGEFTFPKHTTKNPPESTTPGVQVANQFTRLRWADENSDSEPDF